MTRHVNAFWSEVFKGGGHDACLVNLVILHHLHRLRPFAPLANQEYQNCHLFGAQGFGFRVQGSGVLGL